MWTEEKVQHLSDKALEQLLANARDKVEDPTRFMLPEAAKDRAKVEAVQSNAAQLVDVCSLAIARRDRPAGGDEKTFWRLVDKTSGCWRWLGRTNTNHNTTPDKKRYVYGVWGVAVDVEGARPTFQGAHRAAVYYLTGKAVPVDLNLTSLCGDEMCVNPAHRGVVDQRERLGRKEKAIPADTYFFAEG